MIARHWVYDVDCWCGVQKKVVYTIRRNMLKYHTKGYLKTVERGQTMHFSKRISLLAICTLIAGTPYASFGATPTGDKTVTSKSYVTTQLGLKQDKSTAVKYNGSTAVGSATKGVYVDTDGTVKAMTYSLGKDVPSTAKLTDTVTTVTNSDGTAGASTAANGSIKVDKDGTVTYPVVQGWSTKENISNKAKQGSATGSIFTSDSTDDQYPSAKAVYTALNAQSTDISGKQDKSTANYQMGKAGGGWTTMSSEQQNALNSGITSTKVGNYDTHIADTTKHITAAERTAWNAKEDSANKLPQGDATTPVITSTSDDTKFPTAKAVYTALNAQSTSAGNTYQPKSTAAYQMGKAGGGWETMSEAQQNALNSGITSSNKVTHSGAVGSTTKGVYIKSDGTTAAMSYSLGKDVPSTAKLTDTVTTVTNSDGTAGASTAANGSIKVDKDGTVTYPVVQGWSTKENTSNKLAQGSATTSVIAGNATNDTKFPTVKAVADYVTGQGYITSAALPTVNDATLTIQKNGTTIDTFTANSATNKTINIQADKNVIETVKANGTALTVTNKAVDIPLMGAASSSAAGTVGLVPASSAGDQDKVLTAGRTWVVNSTTAVTNSDGSAGASTAANGSIKVDKDGTVTYPVVQGWSTKEDTSNKLAQGSATTSVISSNATSDTKFPTAKAVVNYVTSQGYITSAALPTVNDATLTIQKNGSTIDTFTANAASNKTINVTVPTTVSELTDSANYELKSNKAKQGNTSGSIFTQNSTDDEYPSAKAVYTALNAQSTSAGNTYQPKSTAGYQMGKAGGGWETMSAAQQNALNSGITSTTKVTHTANTAAGSATQPVYIASDGTATATTYELNATVPANAVFSDTTYTFATGSSDGTFKVTPAGGSAQSVTVKNVQTTTNLVTQGTATGSVLSSTSSDSKYPSALAVYNAITNATAASNGTYQAKATANYKVSKSDGTWNDLGTTLDTSATGYVADNAVTAGTIATALADKQPKSTAGYQMGNASGGWTAMTSGQQNALNSTITSTKVGNYDTHLADTTKHITAAERTAWNAKEDSANKLPQGDATTPVITSTSDDTKFPTAKAVYTALNAQSTSAGNTYQPKSTAAYQMGKAGGGWETMSAAQQNALNSGITSTTKVTHTASTAVGSGTKGVYVDANGAVTAMSYSLGKDVPSTAELTDTTYTFATGTTSGAFTVTPEGGSAQTVSIYGWSNKQNKPNKSGETTAADGKVLTYTSSSLDNNIAARYVQAPVATGDPNNGGTVSSLASIWVE